MAENKVMFEVATDVDEPVVQIGSLLLPVVDAVLLVPQLAVAEVLSSGDLLSDEICDSPYCYGYINWREQNIPLLSFDSLNSGQRPPFDKTIKIVICNAVFKAAALGFYAMVVSGFPRSLRLDSEADMVFKGSPTDQKGAQIAVDINGEKALIPDFEFIEGIVQGIVEERIPG